MSINSIASGKNDISFSSQGYNLVGNLYTPQGFDASNQYSIIIFTPPFNQVKEQMAAIYGPKLADKGFLFLSFDYIGYGESEGDVRNYENAFIKMESIRDAISFVGTLPYVDHEKIYGVGACASGGYMALVTTTDKRIKALATVCGMLDNKQYFFGISDRESVVNSIKAMNEARQKQYETGEPVYVDTLGYEGVEPEAIPEGAAREGYDYYMTERAGTQKYPRYSNRSLANIMETNALTDATNWAAYLYTPYLGVYGQKALADTGPLTVAYYKRCSEPKELFEVPGASHVDLYDKDEYVDQAVSRIAEFFEKY